ncbi:MAG: DUF1801 domain-containing protein [Rudaea sp.]
MNSNKTRQTNADVIRYLNAIEIPSRKEDCLALSDLMSRATAQPARMWGPGIVGFGVHKYRYDSGREGEICAVGFASRKSEIALYGLGAADGSNALLQSLGKYKTGKGCLYVKRLADVDLKVLSSMIRSAAKARMSKDA